MTTADFLGSYGEYAVIQQLSGLHAPGGMPYFLPHRLDGKFPDFDILALTVVGGWGTAPLFVQVKTSRGRVRRRSDGTRRLRIDVDAAAVARMAAFPAPVYLVGVEPAGPRLYVTALAGRPRRVRSMSTAHELTPATLARWSAEVQEYWRAAGRPAARSAFAEEG